MSISTAAGWGFLLAYQIGFVLFAVACHRLVLLNEMSFSISLLFSKRIGVFLFWSIITTSGFFVITGAILNIAANLPVISQVFEEPKFFFVVYSLSTIPAFYVLGRFILIFPATAIDAKSGLRKSWRETKGNGWKIALVIGIYPWLISVMIWLVAREKASLLEQVIAGLLYYAGLALEITALSLTYKIFTQVANKDEKYA